MLHDLRQDGSIGPKRRAEKNKLFVSHICFGYWIVLFVLISTRTFICQQCGNFWAVKQMLKLQKLQITAESVIAFCVTRQERNTDKKGV